MKRYYHCPHCGTRLNPNVKIIVKAVIGDRHGLLLLSPQPGNYQIIASESLRPVEGETADLFCPICQENLQSDVDTHLAELSYRTDQGGRGKVVFSRVYGEHATYVLNEETVRSYGENAGAYSASNFFGEGGED
jgi:hypothetical protein